VRRAAHAKVNLALEVVGRRADGFHPLRSVFVRLALHDDVAVQVRGRGTPDAVEVTGDPDCPIDGNLVLAAAAAVRKAAERQAPVRTPPGLTFHLVKRIPIAAGLAGGSSDAAAALELAAARWSIHLEAGECRALALRLGADVPFFLDGHGAALVEGVGERVGPLPAPEPPAGVLLVTPSARLETANVFAAYDHLPPGASTASGAVERLARSMSDGLTGVDLSALAGDLADANDLWPAAVAVQPTLSSLRDDLETALERPLLMTGSGSTLLALYPSPGAAEDAATSLGRSGLASLAGARIIATWTHGEGTA
jgi:4-diphosphocytidyl-2-C-methyl-D-erythritol kinase